MLERLWRQDRGDHLVVLGVDTGPDAAGDGARFVKAHGITYPVVFDPNAKVASDRYAIGNLPVTYVLNPSGRIIGGQILGAVNEQEHSQALMRYVHAGLTS